MSPKISYALGAIPLIALMFALLPAARAGASASQVTILQDDSRVFNHRAATLDELKALGVDVVKVRVDWRSLAPSPNSKQKPSGFSGENPNEYPSGSWDPYDAVVRGIVSRGMRPYLMLGGRGPRWATGKKPYERPNPKEFGRFVQAVGSRYSGSFVRMTDPLNPLPRVTLYSDWNEVNLKSWLAPQVWS